MSRALLLCLLCSGCFHSGTTVRTGEVLKQGEVALGAQLDVATLAAGLLQSETGETTRAYAGLRRGAHPLLFFVYGFLANAKGTLRYGVLERGEVGLSAGLQELSAELRYGLLVQRELGPLREGPMPLSAALYAGAGWRPFMTPEVPAFRGGLELSRRFSTVSPLMNVGVSWAPESYAVAPPKNALRPCRGFGEPGCGEFSSGPILFFSRREVRLQTALGLSVHELGSAGSAHNLTFGVAPYFVLRSEAGPAPSTCVGCTVAFTGFTHRWGAHVTAAYFYE